MFKYFTFFIFLFALEVSVAQDLTATMKLPEVAPPGTDYIVEVTVIKGTINSYIKFTQKLPPRFRATEVESSGGSFTFDDSIVKIVWFFPPAKNEFTFSYKVKVPKEATGSKKIGGKIYYFFNTNREVFSFEKKYVTIGNPKDILAAKEKLKNDSIAAANELAKKIAIAETLITNTVVVTKTDTTITTASISKASDTTSKTQQLPKDLTTASKDTTASIAAKPTSTPSPKKDTTSTPPIKPIAKAVPAKDTLRRELVKSPLPAKDTLLARTVKTTTLITSMEPEAEDKKESAAGEFSYCVQLGAFKEEVPLELANSFFKISARGIKNFKDDNGFTTFTVGNFKTREEALPLKKEMLEKGFQGAFIIAVPANKLPPVTTSKPVVGKVQVENPVSVPPANTSKPIPVKVESSTPIPISGQIKTNTLPEKVSTTPTPTLTPTPTITESVIKGTSSVNRTYRVQIGAFKEEVPLETANKFFKLAAKGIKNLKDKRGYTVYTVGDFSNKEEALTLRNEMIAKGFKDAFIVAFENGEIVK